MISVNRDWGDIWPPMRREAHYGDRVVSCFVDRPGSLYELLAQAVSSNPEGVALVCSEERLTYRALEERSSLVAAGLSARGVASGDRVAILLGNRIEFVVAIFATARLGAISVPINIREQKPGLTYVLNQCSAVLLVHEADMAELLPASEDVPQLRCRVSVGMCNGSEPFAALLEHGCGPSPVVVQEEDPAVILYTSGTTGRPKGAVLTHLGIIHSVMHFQSSMKLSASDCTIASVPLSHITGLVALVGVAIRCASKLVIMPMFKAADFLALAAREGMTHTLMVPAMYNLFLRHADFDARSLSTWRIGSYGGSPMPEAVIEQLARDVPSLTLMNCYGATETTSPATLMPDGKTFSHLDSVGVPLACVEIRVMDDDGNEVPAGTDGEIWIKGPMVVSGYWDNPQATRDSFTAGFWHSGDIGSVDEAGYVRVVDRKKDMINRGGYKIYSAEVENVLYSHPAVRECAVVSKPCPVLGERVHAFIYSETLETSAEELAAFCRPRMTDYKVPETWTLVAKPLLRNANGKVIKRQLREELLASLQALEPLPSSR